MPRVSVTLSANAGVCVAVDGHRIWVDALHEQKQTSFSTLTPDLQKRMLKHQAFFAPEHICFTHCHGDHYSRRLTAAAKTMWPGAKLYLPEPEFTDQFLVSGEEYRQEENGLTLRFIRLPHEGAEYANVKHYGLIISTEGCNILLAGDCAVASPKLAEALGDMPVDLAILDFPWATLGKGRTFLTRTLRAKHILLCHLPFWEDDTCGYRESAKRAADALAGQTDVRLLWEPLQTEEINI
ncbi:MAG: hypothetical protein J6L24_04635 [Oscillospiraceae bacterium]|nr:hypothetical protein [Oscillospiraceae bacterium]